MRVIALLFADSGLGGRHGETRKVQQLRSSFAAINAQSCNHSRPPLRVLSRCLSKACRVLLTVTVTLFGAINKLAGPDRAGPTPAFRPVSISRGQASGPLPAARPNNKNSKLLSCSQLCPSYQALQISTLQTPLRHQDVRRETNKRARWPAGGQAPKARRTRPCTSQCIRQQRVGANSMCPGLTRPIGDVHAK